MLLDARNKCLSENSSLSFDEACLDVINTLNETISIYGQYTECHKCNFQNLTTLKPGNTTSLLFNTVYPTELFYRINNNSMEKCRFQKTLYEHYSYGWNITVECDPIYIKEPAENSFLPILTAFIVLFCFGTLWYMVKCIYKNSGRLRRYLNLSNEVENDLGETSGSILIMPKAPTIKKHPNRIKSIDVFRGLCIAVMIFVNYGGGKYWFFSHSIWNGLTLADLVFPWFMWIMGMSLAISLEKKLRHAVPRRLLFFLIVRRSLILILLGIVINSNHNPSTVAELRYPGVLQRLGITYLIIGLIEVAFKKRIEEEQTSRFKDILPFWMPMSLIVVCLVIHTCITFFVNVPGCGEGYLGPGGLDEGGKYLNCTGGVAGYIDRYIFGEHIYKAPIKLYETTQHYDPEGLLGILTSLFIVYMGVQAGRILNIYPTVKDKVIRWLVWGAVTLILGLILCGFKENDGLIPVNKKLWSLSFVLILSGLAFFLQTFLFLVVDIYRKWGGRPLFYPGMNSLFLYIGHELFKNTFPFGWKPVISTHGTFLFMNLWGTFLWVAISIFLYKHNIFFSI